MTDTDNQACETSFEELRRRALAEFQEGVGTYPADAAWALERQLKKIDAAEAAAHERDEKQRLAEERDRDHAAVARLCFDQREKLAITRKRRGGWWTKGCTVELLSQMLHAVVAKGDPIDVANYCAFIHAKGGKIAPMSEATAGGLQDWSRKLEALNNAYKHTHANPCGDDAYLRGFHNGIRFAYSIFHDREPDYIMPHGTKPRGLMQKIAEMESIPVTDESGVSVGAGRLVPRMPAQDAEIAGSAARRVEPEVQQLITDTVSGIGAAGVPNMLPAGYLVGAAEFAGELLKARRKFPTQASAHEGFAIIAEEMDELKAIVWQKQSERDYAALRKETIQLGAMVLAFLLEVVNPENRR